MNSYGLDENTIFFYIEVNGFTAMFLSHCTKGSNFVTYCLLHWTTMLVKGYQNVILKEQFLSFKS